MLDFLILALAAWRLASLLVNEQGPFGLFARLRYAAGLRQTVLYPEGQSPQIAITAANAVAEGLTCIWCVAVWTAAVLYLGGRLPYVGGVVQAICTILAVAAAAVIIHEGIETLRGRPI